MEDFTTPSDIEKDYDDIKSPNSKFCGDISESEVVGKCDSEYENDSEEDEEIYNLKRIRQKEINEITLKLLTNHEKFNKYLSLNDDNDKMEKTKELNAKKTFFKTRIIDYTSELIDNISAAANNEIREKFNAYIYSVIKHLEYDTLLVEGEDYIRDKYEYKKFY